MKRKGGMIFICLGVVCILLALLLYVHNRREEDQADESAQAVLEILEEQRGNQSEEIAAGEQHDDTMATIEIDGYEYIGTLDVPSQDLSLPVMAEWSYDGLKIAPGRYSGSVWTDDLVIAGHNYRRHFTPLKYLEVGDEVFFTDVEGNEFSYEVAEVTTVQPTAVDEMLSQGDFADADNWDLTLFTCTYGGRARVAVRCCRVK